MDLKTRLAMAPPPPAKVPVLHAMLLEMSRAAWRWEMLSKEKYAGWRD